MTNLEILEELKSRYFVHEETLDYFRKRTALGFTKAYFDVPISEARQSALQSLKIFSGSVEYVGTVRELNVPSADVADGIPVTLYKPTDCGPDPTILIYFHGGGNCVGSRQGADTICKILSRDAECIVVNVEYRLAPEYKFPCNHDDVFCVVEWVQKNKENIGGSPLSTVGVGGDSAGGRLAAVVCHEVKGISFQILIYPSVDSTHSSKAHEEFQQGPGLSKKLIDWFMENYYVREEDITSLRGSPLRNSLESFSNLPPALIIVAEIDPLRDNAILYHEKMKSAGVRSDLLRVPGVVHAFFTMPGHFKESCKEPIEKCIQFIKQHSNA